jgi:hypothetical protein
MVHASKGAWLRLYEGGFVLRTGVPLLVNLLPVRITGGRYERVVIYDISPFRPDLTPLAGVDHVLPGEGIK